MLFTRFQIVDATHHRKLIYSIIFFSEPLLGGKTASSELNNKPTNEPVKNLKKLIIFIKLVLNFCEEILLTLSNFFQGYNLQYLEHFMFLVSFHPFKILFVIIADFYKKIFQLILKNQLSATNVVSKNDL